MARAVDAIASSESPAAQVAKVLMPEVHGE